MDKAIIMASEVDVAVVDITEAVGEASGIEDQAVEATLLPPMPVTILHTPRLSATHQ